MNKVFLACYHGRADKLSHRRLGHFLWSNCKNEIILHLMQQNQKEIYCKNGRDFSRRASPQTNGKAERVIRTLMELWHDKHEFVSSEHRKQELIRFLNFYNTVRPHPSLSEKDKMTGKTLTFTPYEWLEFYFKQSVNSG